MRRHISALDGMRGLAALWVAVGHARAEVEVDCASTWIFNCLKFVHETMAVPAFIVLSGFLLGLPLVAVENPKWLGPFEFMKRRFARIYPAYLATILLCLIRDTALMGMIPVTPRWSVSLPVTWLNVILNLFNLQNLSEATLRKIDPPMWSLAYEWQFYLLLSLIFAPILVKKNWTLAFGILLGCLVFLRAVSPGYSALLIGFATGIFTAYCVQRTTIQWWISAILFVAGGIAGLFANWKYEPYFAVVSATGLILLIVGSHSEMNKLAKRLLDLKPFKGLGYVSFSLYLIHYPMLSGLHGVLIGRIHNPVIMAFAVVVGGLTLSLTSAAVLAQAVEYRWVRIAKSSLTQLNESSS